MARSARGRPIGVKREVRLEGVRRTISVRSRNQFRCYGCWMLHQQAGLRRSVDRNRRRVSCRLLASQLRRRAEGELLSATRSDETGQSEIWRHCLILGRECAGSRGSVRYRRLHRLGGAEGTGTAARPMRRIVLRQGLKAVRASSNRSLRHRHDQPTFQPSLVLHQVSDTLRGGSLPGPVIA
jgi:hypothetical protein